MFEIEIGLIDWGWLNFNKSFSQFDCKYWILDTTGLGN